VREGGSWFSRVNVKTFIAGF